MKHVILFYLFVCPFIQGMSQPVPASSIEDSILGWMRVYHYSGAKESKKIDDKLYSAAQLSLCDSFVNWMQASYIPKGGLGDAKKMVTEKIGLYNEYVSALPQAYGAYTKTYTDLRYNKSGKIEPMSNSHVQWSIVANGIIGIRAGIFCTPSQYYFTLPSFAEQGYDNAMVDLYKLASHPNTAKYFSYFRRNSAIGNEKTILLCKDYKLPFVKITKQEYLELVESTIQREYNREKKSILEKEKGNQRSIDYFMKYLDEKQAKRLAVLEANKKKYASRLEEIAEIFTDQPDIMLENYPDVFEGSGGRQSRLPVYKIDPAIAELCKKDKPQWITITWHGDINDPVGKHQHESIINNFNFAYVYDFFFAPDKIKGQRYRPLLVPNAVAPATRLPESETTKAVNSDKSTVYFEDFSTNGTGQKPAGWKTSLAMDGTTCVVDRPAGLPGSWLKFRGHFASLVLKQSLPQNFRLSYDVVAAEKFTWGAKGLTMQLAKETNPGNAESFVEIKLHPGFDGRDGETTVETKFPYPPGYLNQTKWYAAPGFSNNKKYNRTTVVVIKKEESLRVLINDVIIADYQKAIPAAHLFNALSFNCTGNSSENDQYYISNIKISKD